MPMNWTPNHDPRSAKYPVADLLPAAYNVRFSEWNVGPVLDQGNDGACVGYAIASCLGAPTAEAAAGAGEQIYALAKHLDKWAGEAYSGTSVTAGAKAARDLAFIDSYRWAFGPDDVVDTLETLGPVVLGLYWTEGMMHPVNGLMAHDGPVVGGHAAVATAYDPACPVAGGRPAIRIQNSYGTGWGIDGTAWLPVNDLTAALMRQGEALVLA